MTFPRDSAHDRAILDQFTRQSADFARSPVLHGDAMLALIVDAGQVGAHDRAIDLACGPGSVACALAARARSVVGLDATPAMLDQGRALAARRGLANVEWRQGDIYATPYPSGAFDVVTCRFAIHHLEHPARAFAEMARLAAPGGRIVVCDGLASDDPTKARAFNEMERRRDPSTVEFRTHSHFLLLFAEAGLASVETRPFQAPFLARDLAAASFPADGDREGLLALLEASVPGDSLGMSAERTSSGVRITYHSAVMSAIKPAAAPNRKG